MKLNMDCIRSVLLEAETLPLHGEMTLDALCSALPSYDKDDIIYTLFKLSEAKYLSVSTSYYDNTTNIVSIGDISFNGHQFINTIRDNKVWSKVKVVCKEVGSSSVSAVSQIASQVISAIIMSVINSSTF